MVVFGFQTPASLYGRRLQTHSNALLVLSELSCRSKLASLSDKLNLLEKKVEFLEARMSSASGKVVRSGAAAVRLVAPVQSVNKDQARRSVLQAYKDLQRMTPKFWWDFGMQDMPLGVFRSVLKQQFLKNAHITDIRIIDRLVGETKQHMYAIQYAFYNPDHVRNYLFRENVEPKPKDFLSKFLNGQD
ncbi:unnamed protein product [Heligmosomoides polygyrus]|uniref:NADH dehydrogenase [ubiquinone] 1 alpha subcomplex subunit 6 n=1 Tax=Heligmosomoides polygyrus TaxID=6339 RepID=A0A3P7YR04_HELPZ|nr:unnamed protein product [Heligmosomoides polygyrus]